tara:strand:+ start:822 stop:1010 length:189 start_codon:yes stop_codon:yes gene_type:complete
MPFKKRGNQPHILSHLVLANAGCQPHKLKPVKEYVFPMLKMKSIKELFYTNRCQLKKGNKPL